MESADPAEQHSSKSNSRRGDPVTSENVPEANEQQISRDGEPEAASEYLQHQNVTSGEEDEASAKQSISSEANDQAEASAKDKDQSSREEGQRSSEAELTATSGGSTPAATIEGDDEADDEKDEVDSSARKSVKFDGTSDAGRPSVRFDTSDSQPGDHGEASTAPGITTTRSSLKRRQSSFKTHFADHNQQQDRVTANYNNETFINEEEEEAAEEEEFDPYYGIGAGKDPIVQFPIKMVFGLMNAERFQPMSEANCPGRIKWSHRAGVVLGVAVAAILCFCFALFIHQLVTRPQLPRFDVVEMALELGDLYPVNESIIQQQQRAGKGNYFAYRLNLFVYYILNITNTNPRVDFHIDHVEVSIVYGGTALGYDRLENIDLPRSSVRSPVLLVFVLGLPVSLRLGYTLLPQLRARDFTVIAEFSAKLRMFLLPGLKSIAFRTRYRCQLHNSFHWLDQKCEYLNGDKGVPSHKHLRFWRTSEWPYDIPTLDQSGVIIPLEYMDPAYNYNLLPRENEAPYEYYIPP